MKKKSNIQQWILDMLEKKPGISSVFLWEHLWVSRITIYNHLKVLLEAELVYKNWNKNATRYFKNLDNTNTYKNPEFYESVKNLLQEEYEWLDELNIKNLSLDLMSDLSASGVWSYGLRAFEHKITRENQNIIPDDSKLKSRFMDFLLWYIEEDTKRRKNTLFSGTESLKNVLTKHDMPVSIDRLYFSQLTTLKNFPSIWRLRSADEIYWGKQSQDKKLLESGISIWIDNIITYLDKNKTSHVVFTPPTIKREHQFRDILKMMLSKRWHTFNEIKSEKRVSTQITYKPQKETSWKDRIINARASIQVQDISDFLDVPEIVIFDDNFTTWSTVNAIAEKIREQWYSWKIVALTLTGNFDYIPWVTDLWDI